MQKIATLTLLLVTSSCMQAMDGDNQHGVRKNNPIIFERTWKELDPGELEKLAHHFRDFVTNLKELAILLDAKHKSDDSDKKETLDIHYKKACEKLLEATEDFELFSQECESFYKPSIENALENNLNGELALTFNAFTMTRERLNKQRRELSELKKRN